MDAYILVIAATLIIIVSYFFNIISKRSNVPSVLMLITLGIILKETMHLMHIPEINWFPYLEVLGIVGLIMIVLEAALDLELKRDKWPIIWKSFAIAFLSLFLTGGAITYILMWLLNMDLTAAMLYATPLSIMSSAIIIPSVENLNEHKREFMIYESTFSDILGIMVFYFIIGGTHAASTQEMWVSGGLNVLITVVISFVVSYGLILVFQNIKSNTKLFLLIATLMLMYAISKKAHLSPLLIILVFGLILRNPRLFFRGRLSKVVKKGEMKDLFGNLFLITAETSFVVRTFFFVIFGITISLASLFKIKVLLIALIILALTFLIRYLLLKLFVRKDIDPQLWLAPRGLITVLLYYAIPEEFQVKAFDQGILLFVIIVTSILMAWALIRFNKREKQQAELQNSGNETQNSAIAND